MYLFVFLVCWFLFYTHLIFFLPYIYVTVYLFVFVCVLVVIRVLFFFFKSLDWFLFYTVCPSCSLFIDGFHI